ncbi:S1C family serine protease [Pelagibius sp.]|uniref:S1C family serine protease n=1 Tax=Pelagibius sp. TaxID=1931238 RepID=UPI003BAFF089
MAASTPRRMLAVVISVVALLGIALITPPGPRAADFEPGVLNSVVSVLPLWPGYGQGRQLPPGAAPEGTAVAIAEGGYLVTAHHVVARATSIKVRLPDGREVAAELAGVDRPSDLALLKIAVDLPLLPYAPEPALADPVCAVGNQFGLDLSVTCGVVSAVHRAGTGFNPIEDFIQTDAVVNPGASGGALVDPQGRLVGLLSAIFTKESDANIGVNFAVSAGLVQRVVEDLLAYGEVRRGRPGFGMAPLEPEERGRWSGLRLWGVQPGGAGAAAGLKVGDLITAVDGRPVRKVAEATSAIQLKRPGEVVEITVLRDEQPLTLRLTLAP